MIILHLISTIELAQKAFTNSSAIFEHPPLRGIAWEVENSVHVQMVYDKGIELYTILQRRLQYAREKISFEVFAALEPSRKK
jgi:hypothetical protein